MYNYKHSRVNDVVQSGSIDRVTQLMKLFISISAVA